MKKKTVLLSMILLLAMATPIYARSAYNDNFSSIKIKDWWWLGNSISIPWIDGNWRLEDGALVNDNGVDNTIALVDGNTFSSQVVESDLKVNGPSGSCGVIFWHQSSENWVKVYIVPVYDAVWIREMNGSTYLMQEFSLPDLQHDAWYKLRVETDSITGEINAFVDGEHIFSYTVSTPVRSGKTGVITGNAGGYFDNFKLK